MKTAPWGQDKIMKVDIIEHNSQDTTRMWANAQRDGRPAEHRWRPHRRKV